MRRVRHVVVLSFITLFITLISAVPTMAASGSVKLNGAAANLDASTKGIYDLFLPEIRKIASGKRSSAKITVNYSNQDDPDMNRMVDALVYDCPYEMYWFDKSAGYRIDYNGDTGYTVAFCVTDDYAGGDEYTIDTQKASAAANVIRKADKIIQDNAHLNDYAKILAYRRIICELVSYDSSAAASSEYGNSSQLINVFDGDSNTNVVCEGYAKAFQYLMDNSTFTSSKISSILVDGAMADSNESSDLRNHMWNIVRMDDGKNYLVDVTNCDEGTIGQSYGLMLKGSSNSDYTDFYNIYGLSAVDFVSYLYGDTTLSSYTKAQLELADLRYNKPMPEGSMIVGDNVLATVENGTVTLSGSGATWYYSFLPGEAEPPFKDLDITRVVVKAGITELGNHLFDSCKKLESVSLPSGLKSVGDACFADCSKLETINIPDGVESIGWWSFQNCRSLAKMTLPESITELGASAFESCVNLTFLNIPNKVTRIGSNLIDGCSKLTSINIPAGVTFIDFTAFANSGITSIKLPVGIESIETCTFSACKDLHIVKIPDKVKTIKSLAFSGTNNLTVIIPKNVSTIADDAFENAIDPIIMGKAGSAAEKYAKSHGITFVVICDKHKWDNTYSVDVPATCTESGLKSIHCSVCGIRKEGSEKTVSAAGHKYGKWKITIQPTADTEGVEKRVCSVCGKKASRSVAKLRMGTDGTALGKGASSKAAEAAVTGMKNDSDLPGSVFRKIRLKSSKQTKTSITLNWIKVSGAKKYVIYGNKCGKTYKMKKLATSTGKTRKITKVLGKKVKKGTYYKFMIVALDKNNNVVSSSKIIHVSAKSEKAGNFKSVTIKKSVINKAKKLKKGKTLKLNAKGIKTSSKLRVKIHRGIRYESSNTKIATVTKKGGVVKGKKKGSCYIYAYAQNGVSRKIKITVR